MTRSHLALLSWLALASACDKSEPSRAKTSDGAKPATDPARPATDPARPATDPARPATDGWTPLEVKDGGYRTVFPATPSRTVTPLPVAGHLELITYSVSLDDDTKFFAVSYIDYPGDLSGTPPQELLDGARDGALKNVGATLVSEHPLELKGNPAREVVASVPAGAASGPIPMHCEIRIVLVKQRLYQMIVVGPDPGFPQQDTDRFISAFELL